MPKELTMPTTCQDVHQIRRASCWGQRLTPPRHNVAERWPKDGAMTKDIKEMDTAVFQPCIAASCWRVWRLMLPQIMYDSYDVLGL